MGRNVRTTTPIAERLRSLSIHGACFVLAAILAAPAARPSDAVSCSALDAPLVTYENSEEPFAVRIQQPEGWNTKSLAGGRSLDFYEGENEFGSLFLLRFTTIGPMDPETLERMWSSADPKEISEVALEDGRTMKVRHPQPYISYMAIVPTADGKAYLVNGGVVHARDPCDEQALAYLERIVRGLRPLG